MERMDKNGTRLMENGRRHKLRLPPKLAPMGKTKIILILIVFLSFSCIRIDGAKKSIKKNAYLGIITDIFRDKWNHDMRTFKIKIDSVEMEECADCFPYSWEYARVGDSIIKPPDTLMIIIKKPNGESKEFFYRF